jgi:hypothetical protein
MPKIAFVAGPLRGKGGAAEVMANIRRASELAARVAARGILPVSPHRNTGDLLGTIDEESVKDGYLRLICACDCVVLMNGWESSPGTWVEYHMATCLGIPVYSESDFFAYGAQEVEDGG